MSNIGRTIPSEKETYIDKKSGREITQLTKTGSNQHLYFTENSFSVGDKEIVYYRSDEKLGTPGMQINVFAMDLETGISTQLTDFEGRGMASLFNKSPDGRFLTYCIDTTLYSFDRKTNKETPIYELPVGYRFSSSNISCDNRYIALTLIEVPPVQKKYSGENYDGFKDNFYNIKHGFVVIANIDGSGSEIIFEDTHQIGHVQFAPDTNEYISYCHEGPWNYVQQRIWILNTMTHHVTPCFRQQEDDSVGHEFWTRDGLIFFDNRGKGHDGTITSDKTQAVTVSSDGPDAIPWVGFANKNGNVVRKLDLPYYCNHYHANIDNTLLVADAVEDLLLIDIKNDKSSIEILCEHNTSWRWQGVHCHPTWSWSNNKILFRSDRDKEGYPQLYTIDMK